MSDFLNISDLEQTFIGMDKPLIIGVDEAGAGPLMGPLVATAAILNYNDLPGCIKDSKFYTSEEARLKAYNELIEKVPLYATYILDIEDLNNIADISKAGYLTRYRAVEKLFWKLFTKKLTPHVVLVDAFDLYGIDTYKLGNKTEFEVNGRPNDLLQLVPDLITQGVANGDSTVACIAAASVIAKVERDTLVKKQAEIYPEYKWADNKGYGTKEHLEAIKKYGITRFHRTWYKPCINAKRRVELDVPIVKDSSVAAKIDKKVATMKSFNTIKLFHNMQNSQVTNDNSEDKEL